MPRSEPDDDPYDSVDEDAELELSCALHDLAERVKSFEARMEGRLKRSGCDDDADGEEEIGEDIPEIDDDADHRYGYASPKKTKKSTRQGPASRRSESKQTRDCQAKQQQSDDEEEEEDAEDEYSDDDGDQDADRKSVDWNEDQETEQLCEIKHNIALLLQGIKAEAKALEASVDGDAAV
ncbi:hypothetical protein PINS_up010320 [Pythium insidiosum]|nr:hypothetical protein PINS_up010320 [Pythium insidiosum]